MKLVVEYSNYYALIPLFFFVFLWLFCTSCEDLFHRSGKITLINLSNFKKFLRSDNSYKIMIADVVG